MSYTLDRSTSGRMIIGGMFIIVGTLLLLHKMEIIYLEKLLGIRNIWSAWPIIFIIIGLGKIIDSPTMKKIGEGVWWIFLGVWLYVSLNHMYDLSFRETWPAIIIAWGISVLWESFAKNSSVNAKGVE